MDAQKQKIKVFFAMAHHIFYVASGIKFLYLSVKWNNFLLNFVNKTNQIVCAICTWQSGICGFVNFFALGFSPMMLEM